MREVRFPDWSDSATGRREVRTAIRRVMFKHLGHADAEVHQRAYEYVEKYY